MLPLIVSFIHFRTEGTRAYTPGKSAFVQPIPKEITPTKVALASVRIRGPCVEINTTIV